MIDNITVSISAPMHLIPRYSKDVFEYRNLTFVPRFSTSGELYQYESDLKNLRVRLRPATDKVIICNSFHKYAVGNNYTDFTLKDLHDTCEELADVLDVDVFEGSIKKIEYGCNVLVDDAYLPWQKLLSYQNKNYQPQWSKSKVYGATCRFNNYELKGYNKAIQVKAVDGVIIPDNIFRWEVKATSMAALHKRKMPIAIYKVHHLFDVHNAEQLAEDAVNKYNDSLKNSLPNF